MCTVIYYERLCYCGKDMGSTQEWDCCAEGTQFNGWRHCNVAIRSAGRFVPMNVLLAEGEERTWPERSRR